MDEDITVIEDTGGRYIKKLSKEGEIIKVREVAPQYKLESNEQEATFNEYAKDQIKVLSLLLKKATEKPQETIKTFSLPITNYYQNAIHFHSKQPYFYDKTGMFWFWQDKECKYLQVDDTDVMNSFDKILGFDGQTVTSKVRLNTIEAMKRVGRDNIPQDSPVKWVQFKDKAYSLNSGKIYPVQPNYFFTNPIPWAIGETEETPTIDKLFDEWVGSEYKETLYEVIAYCCVSDYPIHLIFCLIGCGRNGKSKYLGLVNRFIGEDNICSTELDTLLDSRFESFKLFKKLVCCMGETNFGVISKTSLLKKLTGQDLIGFEFKNKKPFDAYNYAKIIISSNSLPPSDDTSEGFYRRWLIINFDNTFPEGHDILKTIPEEEYNNLAKKVIGILPKLLERGKFSNQGTIENRKERYILSSNPLSHFIETACIRDYNAFMRYSELYTQYRKYLDNRKKRAISYKEFNNVLALEGLEVQRTSKEIEGKWVSGRFIVGLKMKPEYETEIQKELMSDMSDMSLNPLTPPPVGSEWVRGHKRHERHEENSLHWDPKSLVFRKCTIENCTETECNFDSYNVPYCKKHFSEAAL